jgi:ATP-dependent DNA helicase RecG
VLETVSARDAAQLAELDIETVFDLITTFPRRHIDRTSRSDVSDLRVGEAAAVLAEVQRVNSRRARNGRTLVELTVQDDTGRLNIVFFNQPWRAKHLRVGTEAIFWAKVGEYRGTRQMVNPVVDVVASTEEMGEGRPLRTLRVLPVYPASAKAGLNSWDIGRFVADALARAGELVDPLPEEWRTSLDLLDRTAAFRAMHAPESMEEIEPARRRLVFDELLRLQLAVFLRRRAFEHNARVLRHQVSPLEVTGAGAGGDSLVARFLRGLPFELTTAQRQALAVIVADLAGPFPMHRLLQGDVGSGKTVVALATLLAAVQGGYQGALMVPTEVLAEQHATAVHSMLGDLDLTVRAELFTSRVKGKARAAMLAGLADGSIPLVVGTHALLGEGVEFASLGAVVIDEQHRFGVEQRAALRAKGQTGDPDLLVMTATPIPRTAAMLMFGDLDPTVLDEMPPGRTPIVTQWLADPGDEHVAWERVRTEVAAGHRAFVVCPLVSESPRVEARSSTEEFERLSAGELAGLKVGLLHGQMPPGEREEVMRRFRAGQTEVLVATTVIEVGVDVPEATVMVIESADRFGIAQLHQLRGRVGRGADASWCYLLGPAEEDGIAGARLAAIARTTDGFKLAEEDLRIRGAGTILGVRQKGQSDLRLARLGEKEDQALLLEARRVADAIIDGDPQLESHPLLQDDVGLFLPDDEAEFLFKS